MGVVRPLQLIEVVVSLKEIVHLVENLNDQTDTSDLSYLKNSATPLLWLNRVGKYL